MGHRPIRLSRITNHFAARGAYASRADEHGSAGHHTGIDFAGPLPGISIEGKAVRSSTPGWVLASDYDSTRGHYVDIYFAGDDVTLSYWHLRVRTVREGDRVLRGEIIGRVGSTGNSTAPHLHVQVSNGKGYSYHDHIAPGYWVRGRVWAGKVALARRARELRTR